MPEMVHVLRGTTTVIVPPVAVVVRTLVPLLVEAVFTMPNVATVAAIPGATVTVAVATTPAWMDAAFIPNSMQSTHPALFAHTSVLPAAVAAGPAIQFTEAIDAKG